MNPTNFPTPSPIPLPVAQPLVPVFLTSNSPVPSTTLPSFPPPAARNFIVDNQTVPLSARPAMPSLVTMAGNLMQTAGETAAAAIGGHSIIIPEEESNKRFEICNNCEFLNKEQYRCAKCGCFMKTKVKFSGAKCPISKW